ncbi:hypothetical protein [Sphingomonas sp. PB4P5]|uniref:hypothetical protein n=1 Tax=Parasphingomonas puruogangriensis TaxID=3096155 RepID=UPI002FCA2BF6
MLMLAAPEAGAQADAPVGTPAPSAPLGRAAPAAGPCVEVDIAGNKAGHLDCASQRLQAATRQAQASAPNADRFDVPNARSADVVTGVANQTATRQRMGNQFGVGVRPQRPAAPVFAPPIGRKP